MIRLNVSILTLLLAMSAMMPLTGCSSAYYATMETFGIHKRDILVDRVEEGRDEQEEAKEQFISALAAFEAVVGAQPSDLRDQYDQLSTQYERSRRQADDVHRRIERIEEVADDLFEEWNNELEDYHDADLRRASARQFEQTQDRYALLIDSMKRAESSMEPVLEAFGDHVLFLKHNLNAQAVASLQGVALDLSTEIGELIQEMEEAIAQADEFIQAMSGKD